MRKRAKIALCVLLIGAVVLSTALISKKRVEAYSTTTFGYWDKDNEIVIYSFSQPKSYGEFLILRDWTPWIEVSYDANANEFTCINGLTSQVYGVYDGDKYGIFLWRYRNTPSNMDYWTIGVVSISNNGNIALSNVFLKWNNTDTDRGYSIDIISQINSQSMRILDVEVPTTYTKPNLITDVERNMLLYDLIDSAYGDMLNLPNRYYNRGNNAGYEKGKEDGFEEGKEYGSQHTIDTGSWITRISQGVGNILGMEIFPNIKLGYFILIPLVFACITWIIKIFTD